MWWSACLLATVFGPELSSVRVELVAGRADLAVREGVHTLVGRAQAHTVEGPAYLESGPASSLAVRWRSEASCELRGVNALEWREPSDGRGVFVSAWRVSELDFEVRRGPLRIDLGSGWRVELAVGAASLRTLADGRIELRHVAGSPLALHRALGEGRVSPPWTLLPGAQVRLDPQSPLGVVDAPRARRALPPPPPGPESAVPARAWESFAWPWAPRERERAPANSAPSERAAPARIESSRIAPAASEREQAPNAAPLDLPQRRAAPVESQGATNSGSAPGADPLELDSAEPNQAAGGALNLQGADRATSAPAVSPQAALSAPQTPSTELAPAPFDASLYPPLRRTGVLVLTPFGPRWADRP